MTTRIKGKLTVEGEGSVHLENVDVEGDIVVRATNKKRDLEAARNLEPDAPIGAVGAGRYPRAKRQESQGRDSGVIVGWLVSLGLLLILAAVVVGILAELSCR